MMAPDSGMAMAIGIVMILMVVGGFLFFMLVGRWIARASGSPPERARGIGAMAGIAGLIVGALAVGWTFYWSD